jgi:hypothetical protein
LRTRKHQLGEVKANTNHFRAVNLEQGQQTPVPGAEVEDATSIARHVLEQDTLALAPMGKLVRATEIAIDFPLVARPLLPGHAPLSPMPTR